jgi:protein-tyrosine phosphatase
MEHDTLSPIIPDKLWMSGDLQSPDALERLKGKIDTILNLSQYDDPDEIQRYAPEYLHWGFDDEGLPDLEQLWRTVTWVCGAIRAGRHVLVHCDAGLNRSGLVCALVIRVLQGFGGAHAVEFIRACRDPYALCNDAFVAYIESAEATVALLTPPPAGIDSDNWQ